MLQREREPIDGCRGGIVTDEAGLGKTLVALSVVAENRLPEATLVVCPAPLVANWREEIKRHLSPSLNFRVFTYEGPKRYFLPTVLIKAEV